MVLIDQENQPEDQPTETEPGYGRVSAALLLWLDSKPAEDEEMGIKNKPLKANSQLE